MDNLNTQKAIKLQLEIDQIADVWYDIYVNKVSFVNWWQAKLWDKLEEQNKQ